MISTVIRTRVSSHAHQNNYTRVFQYPFKQTYTAITALMAAIQPSSLLFDTVPDNLIQQ